ncbi:uncharacterized protein LTR77_010798 [Saxophila tyrrhenica]|uniref:PCI domain-containing protein n=1 Tax=Saxophila tyrrhenica TaxID=1690608 RepID=A0AAV9NW11_9PEZI|nr:hypothetical protein LTR77_010798 [Saxophila tyrrhenica]
MNSAPSYTAVPVRHTLSRPPAPQASSSPEKPKEPFGAGVRAYVQRAFESGNQIDSVDPKIMQARLKSIISEAAEAGTMNTIDWYTYDLPQDFIKREMDEAMRNRAQNGPMTNMNTYGLLSSDGLSSLPSHARKRKSPEADLNGSEQQDGTPPWKKKTGMNGLGDRITGLSKTQERKQQKKNNTMQAHSMDVDPDVLEKRRQRFGRGTPEPSIYVNPRDDSSLPTGPVVGTCQTLEKNYFRLTAPPAPHTVRPLPILEKALDLVRKKWKKEHNYSYACDQLKSLRQDLTVQHIKSSFTVKVYELHARIALEMGDLGEYNQCQTQLRALYKSNMGGNPEEFVAYRILYFIYTSNRTGVNDVLADLTTADKQKPAVQHALQVRSALASGNYHKFFRLYDDAPFMGPYLLDMFVQRERLAAMAAICKAYKPDVGLAFLTQELAFHGEEGSEDDPEAGLRQCVDFLCQHKAEHLIEQKGGEGGEVRVLTGKASLMFENARAAAFRSVDIKGQI